MNEEFEKYQKALTERGIGQIMDCHVPGEHHRYHYHGKEKPGFYVTAQEDGTIIKFFPKLICH